MRLRFAILLLLTGNAFIVSCGENPAKQARKELAQLNIPYSEAAFSECAKKGDAVAVRLFLKAGMNPNAKGSRGLTALMWASYQGKANIVKILLDKGADVNESGNEGATALLGAVEGSHVEIAGMLLDHGAEVTGAVLTNAVAANKINIVKLMLNKDVDVNAMNSDGKTALIIASQYGRAEIVRMLLDKGADVNIKDMDGKTALVKAIVYRHSDIADLLKKAGAKDQ